jgi:hypothetical protein
MWLACLPHIFSYNLDYYRNYYSNFSGPRVYLFMNLKGKPRSRGAEGDSAGEREGQSYRPGKLCGSLGRRMPGIELHSRLWGWGTDQEGWRLILVVFFVASFIILFPLGRIQRLRAPGLRVPKLSLDRTWMRQPTTPYQPLGSPALLPPPPRPARAHTHTPLLGFPLLARFVSHHL